VCVIVYTLQFRAAFCEKGTADAQCVAPVRGGVGYNNVTHWCMANFDGQTDCQAIRDAAESEALDISRYEGHMCFLVFLR
jgi:hypothetical protein